MVLAVTTHLTWLDFLLIAIIVFIIGVFFHNWRRI